MLAQKLRIDSGFGLGGWGWHLGFHLRPFLVRLKSLPSCIPGRGFNINDKAIEAAMRCLLIFADVGFNGLGRAAGEL
jgi:hypothetical protein